MNWIDAEDFKIISGDLLSSEVLATNEHDFLIGYLSMGRRGLECHSEDMVLERITYYVPCSFLKQDLINFKEKNTNGR